MPVFPGSLLYNFKKRLWAGNNASIGQKWLAGLGLQTQAPEKQLLMKWIA